MLLTEIPRKVLIVDDHRDAADAMGMLVEELGNQVRVTYSGRQAMQAATVFQPELVLVDLVMPDMDGCSLIAALRKTPAFCNTKIVVITGHKDTAHREMALSAGCDDVFVKPVALTQIKSALASVQTPQSQPIHQRAQASGFLRRLTVHGAIVDRLSKSMTPTTMQLRDGF